MNKQHFVYKGTEKQTLIQSIRFPLEYAQIFNFPPYLLPTNSSHLLLSHCPREQLSCRSAIFPSLLLLLFVPDTSPVPCSAPDHLVSPSSSSFNLFFSFFFKKTFILVKSGLTLSFCPPVWSLQQTQIFWSTL